MSVSIEHRDVGFIAREDDPNIEGADANGAQDASDFHLLANLGGWVKRKARADDIENGVLVATRWLLTNRGYNRDFPLFELVEVSIGWA